MSLQTTIKDGVKDAMKNKDAVRLSVFRGLTSAFMNEAVSLNLGPQGELTDDQVIAVLTREAKRRKDSIDQYTEGGRPELAADEQAELVVIQEFLPAMMSIDAIKPLAEAKIAEMGADASKMGMVVGSLMKDLKGQANGDDVKAVVESLLK